MLRSYALNFKETFKPIMHASYSVTLLVQLKFSLIEIGFVGPPGILELLPLHF